MSYLSVIKRMLINSDIRVFYAGEWDDVKRTSYIHRKKTLQINLLDAVLH